MYWFVDLSILFLFGFRLSCCLDDGRLLALTLDFEVGVGLTVVFVACRVTFFCGLYVFLMNCTLWLNCCLLVLSLFSLLFVLGLVCAGLDFCSWL